MVQIITGWQCIGCGKIDAPQQCVGVCQDKKVEMVSAADYRAAVSRTVEADAVLRQLAFTTPRDGDWERSYRALQARARRVVKEGADDLPESISGNSAQA
ncbi:MAG TPA: hypothetical protein VFV17_04510 [Usitatibacteraceae bacterium]|nr:hypothetical protein [Usitatibacteraceae bacterium]